MGATSSIVQKEKDTKVMDVNKNVLMLNFGDILEEAAASNLLNKGINQSVIKDLMVLREVRRETSYVDVGPQRLRIIFASNISDIENVAYLASVKKLFKDERCDDIITMIGGDILSPNLCSYPEGERDVIEVLNAAGVDAVNVGKHELGLGVGNRAKLIEESKFSWLNSNIETSLSSAIGFEKYKLISLKKKGVLTIQLINL